MALRSQHNDRNTSSHRLPFFEGGLDEPALPRMVWLVWLVLGILVTFLIWAALAELDEVSTGQGTVISSSRDQIIQSLEGGVLTDMQVSEGDIVEQGAVLAQLDPTRAEASLDETLARYRAAKATATRLQAEVNQQPLIFPTVVLEDESLVRAETALYYARRERLRSSIEGLEASLTLLQQELDISERLVQSGAASTVEVIRLRRQIRDMTNEAADVRSQYFVDARESLAQANAEIESLRPVLRGRIAALESSTLHSPVRGIVKNIEVTTEGGVIPPHGQLMEIVPLDDQLLVETRILPRDIAFIRPGLEATVKITAYDYAIYGGLEGEVVLISPDTIRDEINPEQVYYRVLIRTDSDALHNAAGQEFPILPGMIAEVDIQTGQRTVLDYLVKPLNRAREALRER